MKVRIVCYEGINQWILGKFAKKLHEELLKFSIESDIGYLPDKHADINHHIIYLGYDGQRSAIDTLIRGLRCNMMAIERHDLSQLYPGFAPAKLNHHTSVPLSCATFGTLVC